MTPELRERATRGRRGNKLKGMRGPLVAIASYRLPAGRVTRWATAAYAIPEPYVEALQRAGARPALVTGPDDGPEQLLERFDGVILAGGGDVDPSIYGSERHPEVYGVDERRDAFEIELVRAADRRRVPTLAICRGLQVVNVAFGGTLHQHLPGLEEIGAHGAPVADGAVTHDVKVSESSRLFEACGRSVLTCSSSHHQGIDRLGEGLLSVGWSGDGLVEAVERPDGWLVAVQWHPEDTAAADPGQQAVFDALVERAGGQAADPIP
jgi:putative glutamine amidotransferase